MSLRNASRFVIALVLLPIAVVLGAALFALAILVFGIPILIAVALGVIVLVIVAVVGFFVTVYYLVRKEPEHDDPGNYTLGMGKSVDEKKQ